MIVLCTEGTVRCEEYYVYVVPPTSTKMSIDTHVPRCTTKTLAFAVRNVLSGPRISPKLGHTKVDHVHCVRSSTTGQPDEEVVCRRFIISGLGASPVSHKTRTRLDVPVSDKHDNG